MRFKPFPGTRKEIDLLTGIAPIFRFDLQNNEAHLIGTGFWVTEMGHLVTAWHVVAENIGGDGVDRGPIFAVQTFPDHSFIVRNFSKSDEHPNSDLALSETLAAPPYADRPTVPMAMSLDDLSVGDPVFSFAVLGADQVFENEGIPGHTAHRFEGEIASDILSQSTPLKFAVRLSFGNVSTIHETMRDSVMLPFPCVETNVPIYGGNSGGPLFDIRGRICAAHCSSFEGSDIAYHALIQGVFPLRASMQSLGLAHPSRKQCSILELATMQKVIFDPPMLDADRPIRSILRWLWYAAKCLARRELPSKNIHFATAEPVPTAETSA